MRTYAGWFKVVSVCKDRSPRCGHPVDDDDLTSDPRRPSSINRFVSSLEVSNFWFKPYSTDSPTTFSFRQNALKTFVSKICVLPPVFLLIIHTLGHLLQTQLELSNYCTSLMNDCDVSARAMLTRLADKI